MKILVIEKSDAIRGMAEFYLRHGGANEVTSNNNYVEGLEAAIESVPDLIFLGSEQHTAATLNALKVLKKCGSTRNIPVVICEKEEHKDRLERYISFGSGGLVITPKDLGNIRHLIDSIIFQRKTPA